MRVIAGSARGQKLSCLQGEQIRPTLDRVKESVFNMISFSVPGSSVLDLFAGSGALGIEALSRGAEKAVFVDVCPASLQTARQNLAKTRLEEKSACVCSDYAAFLADTNETFDIIFLDPPYAAGYITSALAGIRERHLLRHDGIIICEYNSADEVICPEGFTLYRNKKYGIARILLMKEL